MLHNIFQKRCPIVKQDKKTEKSIDYIPKCTQQRRSPAPKRRTDFSSLSNQGALLGLSCLGDGSSAAITSLDGEKDYGKKLKELPLAQCSNSWSKGVAFLNAESVSHDEVLDPSSDGSDQHDQSLNKWASSISSSNDGDFLGIERGKWDQKPKIHSNKVTFPLKSERKLRRYKIMRYLGLSAPIGSPF
ncbi:hypothetical protein CFOL_v3_02461 [Cephalotus follicularis]|uniref:Uncharacterized protein n=1 Tax=Cephalotus follicularis TaxID=3775 RepID=A0A1Q3AT60_CEPFO|nr:hypothetical protein CFOL_v3_02461 [Cephalotus follicularis]